MKWAKEISAGNDYLVDFAKQYNESVRKIPTTIDTINVHNIPVDHSNSKLIIGWTGSHTTMNYLQKIGPVIRRLEEKYDFEFRVISNHKPELDLKSFVYVPWSKEDEIEQRDLYDRPPSVVKPWCDGHVALLGDGIHAMMPNLGQGGCQAIEDAYGKESDSFCVNERNKQSV